MKKNLFYAFALIGSMGFFAACSDDDKTPSNEPLPWEGTYELATYTAEDYDAGSGKVISNFPKSTSVYMNWSAPSESGEEDGFTVMFSGLLRGLGGNLLPQVLNSVSLEHDGNITASYAESPSVKVIYPTDPVGIMGILFSGEGFPAASDITATFPTSGFVTSSKGLATWSANGDKLTVKVNMEEIIRLEMGDDAEQLLSVLNSILEMQPTEIKALLATLLGDGVNNIKDATISQLLSWVKNGVPMTIKTGDNGHTLIYLDKLAFDNLLAPNGESGDSDLQILWNALVEKGFISADVATAGSMFELIKQYWAKTKTFDLGMELVIK